MWEEWILDVTNHRDDAPCFCPFDEGNIVFGMNMIAQKSPGALIGIVHLDGQEMADEWVRSNTDWYERYSA